MKINQEKLDLVVDLYLNKITRECSNMKILQGSKHEGNDINELDNVDEELELSNESALDQAMRSASPALKAKAAKIAAETRQDVRRVLMRLLNRS